jgi:hypothetical protein
VWVAWGGEGVTKALGASSFPRRTVGDSTRSTALTWWPTAGACVVASPFVSVPTAGLSDSDAIRHAYMNEWRVLAMLPLHRNLNRFLGEFVSTVPDPMFDALPPLLQELGACVCVYVRDRASPRGQRGALFLSRVCCSNTPIPYCPEPPLRSRPPWLATLFMPPPTPYLLFPPTAASHTAPPTLAAGVSENVITGAVRRRKAQFYLVEHFPTTLADACRRFPGQAPPFNWVIAVVSDVRASE